MIYIEPIKLFVFKILKTFNFSSYMSFGYGDEFFYNKREIKERNYYQLS